LPSRTLGGWFAAIPRHSCAAGIVATCPV
jgi:hypothetical protein